MERYCSTISHTSRYFCIYIASTTSTSRSTRPETYSLSPISNFLHNSFWAYIRINGDMASVSQLGIIPNPINSISFARDMQPLATDDVPTKVAMTWFPSFVNFFETSVTVTMFFCLERIRTSNPAYPHFTSYKRSSYEILLTFYIRFSYFSCVTFIFPGASFSAFSVPCETDRPSHSRENIFDGSWKTLHPATRVLLLIPRNPAYNEGVHSMSKISLSLTWPFLLLYSSPQLRALPMTLLLTTMRPTEVANRTTQYHRQAIASFMTGSGNG